MLRVDPVGPVALVGLEGHDGVTGFLHRAGLEPSDSVFLPACLFIISGSVAPFLRCSMATNAVEYLTRFGASESPEDLRRFRAVVFIESGSVQPWTIGSGQNPKRVIPTGVFRTSDIEQMRMGVLEDLGIAPAPAWLFAAELREGTVLRLLTPFERTVPILAVRPASRRISTKVRIFIEHLEKTFALCSQFNPRPQLTVARCSVVEISNEKRARSRRSTLPLDSCR
jgi:hypothetical protein